MSADLPLIPAPRRGYSRPRRLRAWLLRCLTSLSALDSRVRGRRHALLLGKILRFLRRRIRALLGHALAPRPDLAADRRELLLLRQLEQVARPDHRRLDHPRLPPRPRHG